MPFEVKVESEKLLQQFEDMQKRVSELDQKLPDVFLDWQREDMNRKFPKIDEQAGLSVTTLVYPRSRKPRINAPGGGKGGRRKQARRRVSGGRRPILRPELVEQLFDRMKEMCREAIEWQ
ncbi:hypothetical protein KIP88_02765 [Bradyrhizobium sp. SRL28]|uniref:hypothetical protein n=1 Tax=Bradyrhizobium sp. SRL28 TaxID=2836178 RepID=UPI001BDE0190|nr:hypothetical protein [Bradyrhizobium sp. SRL28]MBT1509413.1 hypothetical protein [Bradyrhizobium sp. SRL28]